MFLTLCREGEFAFTPSGRKVVILGTDGNAVKVADLETAEEFDIMARHLRHAPDGPEGPPILSADIVLEGLIERAKEPK